jgi:predicted transcriptional regulator
MKLTPKEEEIMQIIWELDRPLVRDIHDRIPEPKPHYNTVATVIKKLEEKGMVRCHKIGKIKQYEALVSKEVYREQILKGTAQKYFDNSFTDMVSYFAKTEKVSPEDLKAILKMINDQN